MTGMVDKIHNGVKQKPNDFRNFWDKKGFLLLFKVRHTSSTQCGLNSVPCPLLLKPKQNHACLFSSRINNCSCWGRHKEDTILEQSSLTWVLNVGMKTNPKNMS